MPNIESVKPATALHGEPASEIEQLGGELDEAHNTKPINSQQSERVKRHLPFTFHHLRHFHAVQWLKSGRSIYVLQQRLGHTSVKTTEMYLAFLTPEEKQIAMFGRTAEGTNSGTGAAVQDGAENRKALQNKGKSEKAKAH
jgi:hypothetical protein